MHRVVGPSSAILPESSRCSYNQVFETQPRATLAPIKDRDIAARVDGVDNSVSDDEILAILGKMIKQRKDSAAAYDSAGRDELAAQEMSEIEIITDFLPKQLNDNEIEDVVKKVISDSGASGIRDMGKVMGLLKSTYAGQMDFGKAGGVVKNLLG